MLTIASIIWVKNQLNLFGHDFCGLTKCLAIEIESFIDLEIKNLCEKLGYMAFWCAVRDEIINATTSNTGNIARLRGALSMTTMNVIYRWRLLVVCWPGRVAGHAGIITVCGVNMTTPAPRWFVLDGTDFYWWILIALLRNPGVQS